MPPKSARKSTSGPGRKGTRRLVRPAEVNGEKLKFDDEMKDEKLPYEETVSPKDATASTPEKSSGCLNFCYLSLLIYNKKGCHFVCLHKDLRYFV